MTPTSGWADGGARARSGRRTRPALRLVVDPVRCDGHGICALFFSERIDLDAWGFPVVDPSPFDGSRRARRAVAACPERALSLVARDH